MKRIFALLSLVTLATTNDSHCMKKFGRFCWDKFKTSWKQPQVKAFAALTPVVLATAYALKSLADKKNTTLSMFQRPLHAPIWYDWKNRESTSERKFSTETFYRGICDQLGATENKKIPQKTEAFTRVATYNVHFWQSPFMQDAHQPILNVIKNLDADILILQEATIESLEEDLEQLKDFGYAYHASESTGDFLANVICSKYPIIETATKAFDTNPDDKDEEQRCFVRTVIQLPNNNQVSVYATHLEVRDIEVNEQEIDSETARVEQIKELLAYANKHDCMGNVVIGLDSNSIRQQDLQEVVGGKRLWDLYVERMEKIEQPTAHRTLQAFPKNGYQECFDRASLLPPKFTSQQGTRIDFLFLSPRWALPIKRCGTFYSAASDHIPVFMDIAHNKELIQHHQTVLSPSFMNPF